MVHPERRIGAYLAERVNDLKVRLIYAGAALLQRKPRQRPDDRSNRKLRPRGEVLKIFPDSVSRTQDGERRVLPGTCQNIPQVVDAFAFVEDEVRRQNEACKAMWELGVTGYKTATEQ